MVVSVATSKRSSTQFTRGRRAEWLEEFFSPQYPKEIGDARVVEDIICRATQDVFLSVAECDRCGRLLVQPQPGTNSYLSWSPDEGGYVGALRSKSASAVEPIAAPSPKQE